MGLDLEVVLTDVRTALARIVSAQVLNNMINKTEFRGVRGPDACWLFTGALNHKGYGRVGFRDNTESVHRISAMAMLDYNPDSGLFVLHKQYCKNKNCWNFRHLYLGTPTDNMQDRIAVGNNPWINKTECPQGHPYTEENTYINPKGSRVCKICKRKKCNIARYERMRFNRELSKL